MAGERVLAVGVPRSRGADRGARPASGRRARSPPPRRRAASAGRPAPAVGLGFRPPRHAPARGGPIAPAGLRFLRALCAERLVMSVRAVVERAAFERRLYEVPHLREAMRAR